MTDQLRIEIDVSAAKSKLGELKQSFVDFQLAANNSTQTVSSAIIKLNTALASLKGINPSAIASFGQLGQAISGIQGAGALRALSTGIQQLNSTDVSKLGGQFRQLSAALMSLKVPPGLAATVAALRTLASAAQQAGGALQQASTQMQHFGSAAGSAQGPLASMRGQMGGLNSLLAGFGVALGGAGFANFITGSLEATASTSRFKAGLVAVTGSTAEADAALKFVDETAKKLSLNMLAAREGFVKFAGSAVPAGMELDKVKGTFENISRAARVFGLSTDQVNGVFRALGQIASKGAVQLEELKGQLGDRMPAALQAMSNATGLAQKEMLKLIEQGKVGSDILPKFAEEFYKIAQGGEAIANANPALAFQDLSNALTAVQLAFGEGFFAPVVEAVRTLSKELSNDSMTASIKTIGAALGEVAAGIVVGFGAITDVLISVGSALSSFFDILPGGTSALRLLGVALAAFAATLAIGGVIATVGAALSGLVFTATKLYAGVMLLGKGAMFLAAAFSPVTLALGALAVVAGGVLYATGGLGTILEAVGLKASDFASQFNLIPGSVEETVAAVDKMGGSSSDLQEKMKVLNDETGTFKIKQEELAQQFGEMQAKVTPLPGVFGQLQETVSGLSAPFESLAKSLTPIASAFSVMETAAPNTAAGLTGMQAAVLPLVEPLIALVPALSSVATSFTAMSTTGPVLVQSLTGIAAGMTQAAAPTTQFSVALAGIPAAAPGIFVAEAALTALVERIVQAIPSMDSARDALNRLTESAFGIAKGFDAAIVAGDAFIDKLGEVISKAGETISQMNALKDAADAALAAATAASSAGGGSGGGAGSGRYGGLAGNLPETQTLSSMSVFSGAPQFRDGTANTSNFSSKVPGGGIPSILHPNEAVVPLPKGREIPVDLRISQEMTSASTAPVDLSALNIVASSLNKLSASLESVSGGLASLARSSFAPDVTLSPVIEVTPVVDTPVVNSPVMSPAARFTSPDGLSSENISRDQKSTSSRAASTNSQVIVNMQINTPDTDGFRRSEDQIVRSLADKIRRANRRAG